MTQWHADENERCESPATNKGGGNLRQRDPPNIKQHNTIFFVLWGSSNSPPHGLLSLPFVKRKRGSKGTGENENESKLVSARITNRPLVKTLMPLFGKFITLVPSPSGSLLCNSFLQGSSRCAHDKTEERRCQHGSEEHNTCFTSSTILISLLAIPMMFPVVRVCMAMQAHLDG